MIKEGPPLNLIQLKYVQAVAAYQSISRAAEIRIIFSGYAEPKENSLPFWDHDRINTNQAASQDKKVLVRPLFLHF